MIYTYKVFYFSERKEFDEKEAIKCLKKNGKVMVFVFQRQNYIKQK